MNNQINYTEKQRAYRLGENAIELSRLYKIFKLGSDIDIDNFDFDKLRKNFQKNTDMFAPHATLDYEDDYLTLVNLVLELREPKKLTLNTDLAIKISEKYNYFGFKKDLGMSSFRITDTNREMMRIALTKKEEYKRDIVKEDYKIFLMLMRM